MMSFRRLIVILVLLNLGITAFSPLHPTKQASANHSVAYAALEIVAEVNTHRMSLGLSPLAMNANLSKMAEEQAHYIQSLNFHPENYDYHKDAHGEYPRQRALRHKWPTFGPDPKQIEIGENAGLGSVQFVMDYWRKSNLHRTAMENPAYREVGVGVVEHKYGYFMILVFGARPDVFPTLFDPENCQMYISNEKHTNGGGHWIHSVQTMQLTTADGLAITEPQAWKSHIMLPPNADYQFSLVLRENNLEVVQHVDLQSLHNTVVIPNTLPMLEKGEITTRCVTGAPSVVAATPIVPTLAPTEDPVIATATTPAPTEAPLVVTATTPAPPPPTVQANVPPTATPEVKVETVNNASSLNPTTSEVVGLANVGRSSNLQCRQYPSSIAFSLGLIPSGSTLTILGLPGARDERIGFPDGMVIEIPDYAAARLGEGVELDELWLHVQWQMPEGTFLKCWVNAFYVSASYQGKSLISVASYLELVQRGKLDFIPYNVPGGPFN